MHSSHAGRAISIPLPHALLIFFCIALAYWNALPASFQFDDFNVIVNEPRVHNWAAWLDSMPGIRPLLKASYTLNWSSGFGITGFHLFNISIHLLNSLLLYALAQRFYLAHTPLSASVVQPAALFVALLFALHPAQTEAVTYISGRSISLAATFYLASLLAYTDGRTIWRAVSVVCFVLALTVKEITITLPLALLLWDSLQTQRPSLRTLLQRQWPYWLLVLVGLFAILLHPVYRELLQTSLHLRSLTDNLLTSVQGISYLLGKLLLPLQLNIDPEIALLPLQHPLLLGKLALLIVLLLLAIMQLRRRPWLTFAILWFFLHLLPTHSLIPRLDIANERQLYLAGIGPFLLFAFLAGNLLQRYPQLPANMAAMLLCVLLGLGTVNRNADYRSEVSLWQAAAETAPGKARIFNNLGYAWQLEGQYTLARQAYLQALQLEPDNTKAAINLANLPPSACPEPCKQ